MAIKDNETPYPWIPAPGTGGGITFLQTGSSLAPNGDIVLNITIFPSYTPELRYGGNVYDDSLLYGTIEPTVRLAKRNTSGEIVQEKVLRFLNGAHVGGKVGAQFSLGYYPLPGIADDAFSYED